ncbi:hypothetical protein GPAL_3676 [Glaciecola pallidula DSM 14239 = ACAM 615]|uniref:Uncharacterized protein n=1 Tax=Brumicola pallidula DSM 14239 = ACAM 615 TaxID=1121922 RepID=K6ZJK8_9ALTE|nr:hypothetical protein GPAL_3676 [Glaciecola pallidula DSM 14239 = ACAM 615]
MTLFTNTVRNITNKSFLLWQLLSIINDAQKQQKLTWQ